ncbi:hypothetical protein B0H63DRAFT_187870 [Podospora didyma]|uniref:C2H2-type domain-containing protein n=1 Tax=Podospora didyma TaxID=330526 RepID=A0AAE0U090_9PEZI|nr:hypothetical protein B0H63DRAFT_187870 [Podospora didyma]
MRHLCHGKAEEEKIPSKPKEGMSLQEKMLMWQSESRANSPEIDATDHFEGVEDIDDSLSHIELSAYSNIIFKSQSYDWLVKTLIKESLFHWDNSQPNIMVHDIREEIMKALPTGRISRKESPCTYKTTFSIQWLPIKQRLEREQTSNGLTAIESVFSTIVLTSSSIDHIQAMTTEEYINQTWTSGGKELLQVIGDVFEDSQTNGSDVTVYGPYKNDIVKATLRGLNVDIVVTGSPRAVSERGEMIAWLVAALQDPGARNLVQYFPSLGKQGAKQCIGQQPEDSGQSWKVEINPVIAGDAPNLSPLRKMGWLGEKDGWLGGIIQPVIVRGFPTTRRPFPGIEVSTNVLFSPLSAIKFDASRHQVSLPGTDTLLELVKEIDGVCLWHVLFTPSSRCECATHPRTRLDLVGDIRKYRHVIGDCLWTCNSSQRLSSHPADFVSDKATGSHIMDLPRTESSITNSKDTPIDSDMMSIPDSPENDCPSPLATPHVLSPVIRAVAFRLVDSYREARLTTSGSNSLSYSSFTIDEDSGNISTDPTENESPSNDGRPTSSGAVNHAQGSDQNPPSPSRKRMRDDEGDDNEDPNNGRNPMPPPKRPKRGSEIPSGKSLACPFWKFDPEQHKDCLKTKQRYFQVNRVKQHLTRRHTKVYCERCKTIFKDEPGHQHHLEHAGPACVFKPWNPHHGVTRRQQAKLHKKSSSSLTDSEQWFAMWAILFPNRPQPRSPYIDQYLSDDLRHFREYAQDRGSQFLSEDLLSRGLSLPPELTSDEAISSHLARIISSGMDRMIEDWISSGHNGDRGPRRGQDDEPRSEPSEHETAAGSLADSGLGLSSSQPGLQLESIFHINDTNDPITLPVPNIVVPTDDQVPMECNEQQPNFVGYSLTLDFDFEGSNDFSADMQDHSESNCWDETFGGGYDFHDQT